MLSTKRRVVWCGASTRWTHRIFGAIQGSTPAVAPGTHLPTRPPPACSTSVLPILDPSWARRSTPMAAAALEPISTPTPPWHYDFVHTMLVGVPAANGKPATSVVVGTGKSGLVIGMDPANGRQLWRTPVGEHLNDTLPALSGPTEILPGTFGGVLTPPASAHGTVFVATLNAPDTLYPDKTAYFGGKIGTMPGEIVAINARTGKHLWDTKVPGDPTGCVTLVNNLVFTATYEGKILALSASNGKLVWQMPAPGGINGCMSIVGDTIVVPVGLANPAMLFALHLDPPGEVRAHVTKRST
jgi:outer membrane protein assembly factor BamB